MMIFPSLLLSSLMIIAIISASIIEPADNFEANMLVLYNSSATSMSNQVFVCSFSTSFNTTPVFAFGINNYKLGDLFKY